MAAKFQIRGVGNLFEGKMAVGSITMQDFACRLTASGHVSASSADLNGEQGYAIPLAAVDNTGGTAGGVKITLWQGPTLCTLVNAQQKDEGKVFYAQSKTALSSSGNGGKVGVLLEYISATQGWVDVGKDKI